MNSVKVEGDLRFDVPQGRVKFLCRAFYDNLFVFPDQISFMPLYLPVLTSSQSTQLPLPFLRNLSVSNTVLPMSWFWNILTSQDEDEQKN